MLPRNKEAIFPNLSEIFRVFDSCARNIILDELGVSGEILPGRE
jgi:hypothetical protein